MSGRTYDAENNIHLNTCYPVTAEPAHAEWQPVLAEWQSLDGATRKRAYQKAVWAVEGRRIRNEQLKVMNDVASVQCSLKHASV